MKSDVRVWEDRGTAMDDERRRGPRFVCRWDGLVGAEWKIPWVRRSERWRKVRPCDCRKKRCAWIDRLPVLVDGIQRQESKPIAMLVIREKR